VKFPCRESRSPRGRARRRNALRLGGNAVERLAQAQVAAQHLLAAGLEHLAYRLVGIVAGELRLLADQLVDLGVAHLEAELVGDRLEHELARDREGGFGPHPLHELLRGLAGELEVRLGGDAAALERAPEPVQQLACPRLDERPADLDVRSLDEHIDRGRPELRLGLLVEHVADALLDVCAQLLECVELARGARQLVVERRQDLLLDLLDLDRRRRGRAVGALELDLLGLARRGPGQRALDLLEESARAELDDEVALPLAALVQRVDHQHVACAGGSALYRSELSDRLAQRLELLVDELLGHLRLREGHLKLRPVRGLGLRLHGDRGGELKLVVLRARQFVVVLGRGNGPDACAGRCVQEPAADVALDRLAEDPLAPDARLQHLLRDLALAEAWDLDRLGEVVGRVLDGMLEVGLRDLDRQPDLVVGQLLDLGRHDPVHSSKGVSAAGGPSSGGSPSW
jgi:hypothetical protein